MAQDTASNATPADLVDLRTICILELSLSSTHLVCLARMEMPRNLFRHVEGHLAILGHLKDRKPFLRVVKDICVRVLTTGSFVGSLQVFTIGQSCWESSCGWHELAQHLHQNAVVAVASCQKHYMDGSSPLC